MSTFTILVVLWDAGYTSQQARTWCPTDAARRKRRDGPVVETTDPHATPPKEVIERAYGRVEAIGLRVWYQDEASHYQAVSQPVASW